MKTLFALAVLFASVYSYDGHTCFRKSHNRGIGKKRTGCPKGTEVAGLYCRESCPESHPKSVGSLCWTASHPKRAHKRKQKIKRTCKWGTEESAGLCYALCPRTMYPSVTLCKETCPWKGFEKKGQICTIKGKGNKENLAIAKEIFKKILEFAKMLANLVTFFNKAIQSVNTRDQVHNISAFSGMGCDEFTTSFSSANEAYEMAKNMDMAGSRVQGDYTSLWNACKKPVSSRTWALEQIHPTGKTSGKDAPYYMAPDARKAMQPTIDEIKHVEEWVSLVYTGVADIPDCDPSKLDKFGLRDDYKGGPRAGANAVEVPDHPPCFIQGDPTALDIWFPQRRLQDAKLFTRSLVAEKDLPEGCTKEQRAFYEARFPKRFRRRTFVLAKYKKGAKKSVRKVRKQIA